MPPRARLLAELSPLHRASVIETRAALGRVTAEDVLAPHPAGVSPLDGGRLLCRPRARHALGLPIPCRVT